MEGMLITGAVAFVLAFVYLTAFALFLTKTNMGRRWRYIVAKRLAGDQWGSDADLQRHFRRQHRRASGTPVAEDGRVGGVQGVVHQQTQAPSRGGRKGELQAQQFEAGQGDAGCGEGGEVPVRRGAGVGNTRLGHKARRYFPAHGEVGEMARSPHFLAAVPDGGVRVAVGALQAQPVPTCGETRLAAPPPALAGQVAGGEGAPFGVEVEAVYLASQGVVEGGERQFAMPPLPRHACFHPPRGFRQQVRIAEERVRRVAEPFDERRVLHPAPNAGEPVRIAVRGGAEAVREGVLELVVEIPARGNREGETAEARLMFGGNARRRGPLPLVRITVRRRIGALGEVLGSHFGG